jgi:prevent-host-death family protein
MVCVRSGRYPITQDVHVTEGTGGTILIAVATGSYILFMKHEAKISPYGTTVSMKDAKNRLTELARRVEAGETVTITRNGKPVLDMVPHKKKGGLDLEAGRRFLHERGVKQFFTYVSDDFDDPLPEDFLLRPLPPAPKK